MRTTIPKHQMSVKTVAQGIPWRVIGLGFEMTSVVKSAPSITKSGRSRDRSASAGRLGIGEIVLLINGIAGTVTMQEKLQYAADLYAAQKETPVGNQAAVYA